jgi:hypothetical protein
MVFRGCSSDVVVFGRTHPATLTRAYLANITTNITIAYRRYNKMLHKVISVIFMKFVKICTLSMTHCAFFKAALHFDQ